MKRVTMGLTDADVRNTDLIQERFQTRSKAGAVGTALSMAASISDELSSGNEILVREANGEMKKLIFSGFNK